MVQGIFRKKHQQQVYNQSRRSLEGPQAQIQIYIIILLILDIRRVFRCGMFFPILTRKKLLRVIIAMYLHQRGDEGGEILLEKIRFYAFNYFLINVTHRIYLPATTARE